MAIGERKWRTIAPGDCVETAAGEPIGVVAAVREGALLVFDPVEGRQLSIPREVVARKRGRRVRLQPRPVRAAGDGPERYRAHPTLDDDCVAEQAQLGAALTVEGADPLDWRRLDPDGNPAPPDADE